MSLVFFGALIVWLVSSSFGIHSSEIDDLVTRVARKFSTGPGMRSVPSSKHWIILPPYAKQSTGGCGISPRHNGKHFGITPLRLQHGVWSRPPAAHLLRTPTNNSQGKSKFSKKFPWISFNNIPICKEHVWPSNCRSETLISYVHNGIHCGKTPAAWQHAVILYDGSDSASFLSSWKRKVTNIPIGMTKLVHLICYGAIST